MPYATEKAWAVALARAVRVRLDAEAERRTGELDAVEGRASRVDARACARDHILGDHGRRGLRRLR